MFVTIVTASRSGQIGQGLTYETEHDLKIGQLVRVPLRKSLTEGIVVETNAKKPDADVKEVHSILSAEPLIPEPVMRLMTDTAAYYMCSLRHMLTAVLPAPPWRLLLPPVDRTVRLRKTNPVVRGKKQQSVIDCLSGGDMPLDELMQEAGATLATIKGLEKKRVISIIETPRREAVRKKTWPVKNDPGFDPLFSDSRPSFLFDKTYVPIDETIEKLTRSALGTGKSVLVICPEMSAVHRFNARFPQDALILGSDLSPAKERQTLRQIAQGRNQLIIGTRSAVFAPVADLGLMIVLDEHDDAYKNEQTPKYHVREVAVMRSRIEGNKCVFVSKTPSLEAFLKLQTKAWHRATLNNAPASGDVQVVDLTESRTGKWYPLSSELVKILKEQLDRGETSLLYLNQRGFATTLLCTECKQFAASHQTGLPLTVHQEGNKHVLIDHQTNDHIAVPNRCPNCGSPSLISIGAGTQKVEQLLQTLFPQAKIMRFDRDALKRRQDVKNAYEEMKHRRIDIAIGTTTVLRTLELPSVTFACAVLADVGLSIPHFRAGEHTFHALFRLVNAMQGKKNGRAMLQTFRPGAPEIHFAAKGDSESYLQQELKGRAQFDYPPHRAMISLIVRGAKAEERAQKIFSDLLTRKDVTVQKYRMLYEPDIWLVTVRGENPREAISQIDLQKAIIDVDPLTLI